MKWNSNMSTAPRDGRCILLFSKGDKKAAIGKWAPEGNSWVDEFGCMDGEGVCTLAITGVWESNGGWFQPNEVTHWAEITAPEERE